MSPLLTRRCLILSAAVAACCATGRAAPSDSQAAPAAHSASASRVSAAALPDGWRRTDRGWEWAGDWFTAAHRRPAPPMTSAVDIQPPQWVAWLGTTHPTLIALALIALALGLLASEARLATDLEEKSRQAAFSCTKSRPVGH